MQEFKVGDSVETIDNLNHRKYHVNYAVVVRLTATLVVVLNEHGNRCKYYRKNGHAVGYSWPHSTYAIQKCTGNATHGKIEMMIASKGPTPLG